MNIHHPDTDCGIPVPYMDEQLLPAEGAGLVGYKELQQAVLARARAMGLSSTRRAMTCLSIVMPPGGRCNARLPAA